MYGGTSITQSPLGQNQVAVTERWPLRDSTQQPVYASDHLTEVTVK